MKKRSKKGFTLAELLIVIAIIAILIAIMFPVFGAQLDKARAAAELANVRAAYSEAVADAMLGDGSDLTASVTEIEVDMDDLDAALTYPETLITYTPGTPATIKVEYKTYSGTFNLDDDVTVDPATNS